MTGPVGLGAAVAAVGNEPLPSDLEGACRALEKEFALLVFRSMRKAMVPKSTDGATGFAEETAYALLDEQWAELATQGEGLGLWRAMMRQLEGVKKSRGEVDQESEGASAPVDAGRTRNPRAGAAGRSVEGMLRGRRLDRSA
ncbi:MAG: hypothetical protein GXP50_12445 [Deltaproteobacteria bacterium]|nr:hypothetical protein [Deltaproteobacteria bacterium]